MDRLVACVRSWRNRNRERYNAIARVYQRSPKGRMYRQNSRFGQYVDPQTVRRLWWFQGGRCQYCNKVLVGYEIDHMTPLTRGGRHEPSNICLACRTCNRRKNTKTAEEFV